MSTQGTKSVLEYTKEELQKLPVEQLKILLDEAKTGERQYWTEQTGLKLIINSIWGNSKSGGFPLFNEKMAQGITGNGRFFIRLLSKNMRKISYNLCLKPDNVMLHIMIRIHLLPNCYFVDMFITKNPDSTINEQVDFC